jgi:Starch synthase catalytic domain
MRVLLISWEYPPVIEGGLGRHVRKLSEQLVRDGIEPRTSSSARPGSSGWPATGCSLRFPPRDATALRGVLERVLIDDAEPAQLVAEAREHVLRFDWAEVARRTAAVYRVLASATSRAR